MNTTITTTIPRAFVAVVGKSGKVSVSAGRALTAVSGASAPVQLGLAIHGSALTRRTAVSGFDVVTLESVLTLPALNGSQWPDVYALLADRFGYAVEGGRGKAACRALLDYAQAGLDGRKIVASSDGCTEAQQRVIMARQTMIDQCREAMQRWQDAADAASVNALTVTE